MNGANGETLAAISAAVEAFLREEAAASAASRPAARARPIAPRPAATARTARMIHPADAGGGDISAWRAAARSASEWRGRSWG